ncbi:LysE family translocator [Klebsiella aerogenes]|uniref:LysE family translocator n=1 Tax=Klebsiella aerogenes TaxID=548 RepID=UPI0023B9BB0A|nr:LysE family translocator [Klebsiella aerogenes]ELA1887052.1 LysE family translocator [Klebsiella aerogenes]MDF0547119.1 LysE family translocator [Klebsiella aerogenes]
MPELASLIAFAALALGLVLTPGPNMIYLTSRSICQGKRAGLISLAGVALGFIFYMLCAAFGISALVFAVPYAYDALRVCGVAYLLYLAWQAIKPGARSIFAVRNLPADSGRKLFLMGFITNLANPKIAIMYLSLLPQFITPGHGSVLSQSLVLGFIQALISVAVNGIIVVMAGQVALFLGRRPGWQQFQRWLMASVLAGMAVKIAFEARK